MIEADARTATASEFIQDSCNNNARSKSNKWYDHDDDEINEKIILLPSNSREILRLDAAALASKQQKSGTILMPISRRSKEKVKSNKNKSPSFNINYDSNNQLRECSRKFCQTSCAGSFVNCRSPTNINRKRHHKHNNSSNYHHHHHHHQRCRPAQIKAKNGTKIHKSRRSSLASAWCGRSISLKGSLLALSALLSCLVLFSTPVCSPCEALSESHVVEVPRGELNGGDLNSATSALSQQQQHQIPFSVIQSATNKSSSSNNNNNNNNIESVQSVDKQHVTTKRAARAGPVSISESELMPFSEFIIRPAAFGDLMKSWPPTTLRAAASSLASAADSLTNRQKQQQQQLRNSQTNPIASLKKQRDHEEQQNLRSLLTRNHLNEDLDDTIVTADQSFEREQTPEPETWINYLGDLGDYIYMQLKQYLEKNSSSTKTRLVAAGTNKSDKEDPSELVAVNQQQRRSPLKLETIDELLDDYYYDQYENSQVLYYGAQLVREHESFEIGCFLPIDQQAEWTKSGRPLAPDGQASPRTITRSLFLSAKQNFTLKVFTASISDSGNYRCSKMSRKFHKLIVVPDSASPNQVYAIQQRLLSVVSPNKLSSKLYQFKRTLRGSSVAASSYKLQQSNQQLYPGYLIVENEPLVVNCNISDTFVLRRLKDNPQFRLAWYKNGKQLPGSKIASQPGVVMPSSSLSSSASNHHHLQRGGSANSATRQIGPMATTTTSTMAHQTRIQFLDQNGRKLFISSAHYSDAGEYLCSWSNLPARQLSAPDLSDDESNELLASQGNNNNNQLVAPAAPAPASNDQLEALSRNPLAAGSLSQLIVPVKLRPFKSTYHVRKGNQLRLVCQLQRGYPQAQLAWYIGNRLVDAEFLKERAGQYKILYLQNQNQLTALASSRPAGAADESGAAQESGSGNRPKIVEVNPIPMGKLQMQLTQDGKWLEYRELNDEKAFIDTNEQQLRYMQQKFARLTGINISGSNSFSQQQQQQQSRAVDADTLATLGQMSISMLIVESLDIERDTMRYACRATNRANTDEVTTVIRVQASSTVSVRPSSGRATLTPGKNLNFQCSNDLDEGAQFWWYRRKVDGDKEHVIEPNDDDHIEIHNNRLSLVNPSIDYIGDYYCKQIVTNDQNSSQVNREEAAIIRVRTQPIIEDLGIELSHTGKSSTVREGDRLELICTVYDKLTPVNITWLRSMTSDDETSMVPLREGELEITTTTDAPRRRAWNAYDEEFNIYYPTHYVGRNQHGIEIQSMGPFSKKLIIESVSQEHRSHYACVADNGITERTKRIIFIRVKDRLIALWPLLGILAEFFILFTIIKIWETQRFNHTYGAASAAAGPSSRALLASK